MAAETETQAGEVVREENGHDAVVAIDFPLQPIPSPRDVLDSSTTTTIPRVPEPLRTRDRDFTTPIAVAIGPYHHRSSYLREMDEAKNVARDEFCRAAGQPPEAIHAKIASLTADARGCYDAGYLYSMDDDDFAEIMFKDGCFLLRFMACMCPGTGDDAPALAPDGLWAKVHARADAIARDTMLLENQLPWLVLQALMGCAPPTTRASSWRAVVDRFLDLMASAFDVGNVNDVAATYQQPLTESQRQLPLPPPHLLGLFHRRQVGAARTTQYLTVPRLSSSSLSSTAVELAEMGVQITASKARVLGYMTMTKRRPGLGIYGELSIAPVLLSDLTSCWLFNMVALEACLAGAAACAAADFAVSSYVSVVSLLMNRAEDVQELRGNGVVVSALSDETTLATFKGLAAHVRVGYRYYDVLQRLQEYPQERWLWIAVHGFLHSNYKTIVAVFSAIAGLFKAILSLKHPQQG